MAHAKLMGKHRTLETGLLTGPTKLKGQASGHLAFCGAEPFFQRKHVQVFYRRRLPEPPLQHHQRLADGQQVAQDGVLGGHQAAALACEGLRLRGSEKWGCRRR